jgi:ABC-type branched-subunit amino acid transport system ATPase component
MSLLELDSLTVRYGGVTALDSVSFAVEPGSLVGLIGPNGAGKTTLIDAVTGMTRCSGRLTFGGRPIAVWPAHCRSLAGIVRTFQSAELFQELTVVLLIDHDVDLMMKVSDIIHVLNFGRLIASGKPVDVRADPLVAEAYLGSQAPSEVA